MAEGERVGAIVDVQAAVERSPVNGMGIEIRGCTKGTFYFWQNGEASASKMTIISDKVECPLLPLGMAGWFLSVRIYTEAFGCEG